MATTHANTSVPTRTENRTAPTRRRFILGAGVLGVAAGSAAACGTAGSDASNPGVSTQPVSITSWLYLARTHPTGAAFITTLEEQAEEISAKVGVRVRQEVADTGKILIASAAGTPPESAWIPYFDAARLDGAGAAADLDAELKKERQWPAQRRDFFEGMLQTSTWRGRLVAIPFYTNGQAVCFDRAALTKAGVAVPNPEWKKADFVQMVTRTAAPPDRWGLTFTPSVHYFLLYGGAGGELLNRDSTRFTLDNDIARETLRFLHDLTVARQVSPSPPNGELMRTGQGKVAFELNGNYRIATYRDAGIDVGAVRLPMDRRRFGSGAGASMAALQVADAAARAAAARLAAWVGSAAFQVPFLIKGNQLPVSKSALEHKDYKDFLGRDPVVKVFADETPYSQRIPIFPSGRKAETAITDAITKALTNQIGLNDAIAEAQREAQRILDEDLKLTRR